MPWQRILITGATSGMGYELAQIWRAKGADVLAIGRSESQLEKLKKLGCTTASLDLSTDKDIEKARSLVFEYNPTLIIHGAGGTQYALLADRSWADLCHEHRLHTLSTLALLHALTKLAKEEPSPRCFLVISSALAYTPAPGMSLYSCGKQWVLTLSRLIALEDAGNLHVLCTCPGPVHTNFHHRASSGFFEDDSWGVLSAKQAACQIMDQITNLQAERPLGIKSWIAKVAGALLPTSLCAKILRREILKRLSP